MVSEILKTWQIWNIAKFNFAFCFLSIFSSFSVYLKAHLFLPYISGAQNKGVQALKSFFLCFLTWEAYFKLKLINGDLTFFFAFNSCMGFFLLCAPLPHILPFLPYTLLKNKKIKKLFFSTFQGI